MHDPHDRDRQQRELTEELRQDAHRRAERKRRATAVPEPAPPGTPTPGHARPDDDLGTEMPELPPEAFPDPSPNPFRGDPAPPSEEHPTARPPHPQIMMERRRVDARRPSARHDA